MDRCKENVIEWIEGEKIAKCTFSQKKFINRIRRMSATHGSCVKILAENMDGSILASIPYLLCISRFMPLKRAS